MLKKILIYSCIGFVCTFGSLTYINNYVLGSNKTSSYSNPTKENSAININITNESKCIYMTNDLKYITYIDGKKLNLKNISTKVSKEIGDNAIYSKLVEDKNIIIYISYNGKSLNVKTYNIDTDENNTQVSIPLNNVLKIRELNYSNSTNMIFLDCEMKDNKNRLYDNVYKIDIMKHVKLQYSKKDIVHMTALGETIKNEDVVVYENSKNEIFAGNKRILTDYKGKLTLIGKDSNNMIYLKNGNGNILVVNPFNDYIIDKTINIDDKDYKEAVLIENTLYVVYNNYILDAVNNKKIDKSINGTIINIVKNNIIYKTSNNVKVVNFE